MTARPTGSPVRVRRATDADLPAVLGVLDAAALETDLERVRASVGRGDALVALDGATDDATILGALVLDGATVASVAVRPRRRGQGVGTALVRAAAGRRGRLVAQFRADVRPFYESLGFDVEPTGDGRFRGVLATSG